MSFIPVTAYVPVSHCAWVYAQIIADINYSIPSGHHIQNAKWQHHEEISLSSSHFPFLKYLQHSCVI